MRYGCPDASFSDETVVLEPALFIQEHPECKDNFNYMMSSFPSYPWYLRPFNVVLMMRQVNDRMASAFLSGYEGCPSMYRAVDCAGNASAPRFLYSSQHLRCLETHSLAASENQQTIMQYASCVSGFVTNLLGGGEMHDRIAGDVPATIDISPKIAKRSAYVILKAAFVGLTESFDASICLFHAKFGGMVHEGEFLRAKDGRAHKNQKANIIDTLNKKGFIDSFDGKLYTKARTRFFKEKKAFLDGWTGVEKKIRNVGKRPKKN